MTKDEILDRVWYLEEDNQKLQDCLDAFADLVNGDDEEYEKDEDSEGNGENDGSEEDDEDDQD